MAKILENTVSKIKVPEGKRDVLVFDESLPGFGICKFATGKASFFVKYQIGGQQRKLSLGPVVPGVAAEMRRKASDILAKARLGQDVVAEKQAAALKGSSVEDKVKDYLDLRQGEIGARYHAEVARYLSVYAKPLHGLAIEAVSRKHVVALLDDIAKERGKVTADRAKEALSTFFLWLFDKGHIETNPVIKIERYAKGGGRSRVLTEAEIVEIWAAGGEGDYAAIVRLLILTGQRRDEVGSLSWDEINREKQQIELPPERTKNKKPHIIPLSAEALAIIDTVLPHHQREHLFGEGASRGFQGWSKAKPALDKRIAAARAAAGKKPIPPWVVHDIRRSVITHMNEHGIAAPHVIEFVVNHVSGTKAGVAGVYNRSEYANERRAALEAWGRHVASLVAEPGDV